MKLTLKDICKKTGGTLFGADMTVTNLVTDSRKVTDGCVFAVIKGERVDAMDFVPALDSTRTCAYLTDREIKNLNNPYILVDDVIRAIGDIAALHLDTIPAKHIAITGSVGKTTTKNYIAAALSACMNTHYAKGNFNNELGMPLTALGADEKTDALILEMGMRGMGQIEYLCNVAKPHVSVITNIGICHMELLGSRENILKAKCEIIDALDPSGVAVINADDDMLSTLTPPVKTLRFGIYNQNCDIRAINVVDNTFTMLCGGKSYDMTLSTLGEHNIYNALCAAAVAFSLGCDMQKAVDGICAFAGDGSRQSIYNFDSFRIFDDTYNASPASMTASMTVMGGFEGRKVLVLADMLELGDLAKSAHSDLAKTVKKINADVVICIGELMKNLYNALDGVEKYHCENNDRALKILISCVKQGDNILFKGSNSMDLAGLLAKFKGEWKNEL